MSRILFVCLGNICRSPLAEGIMLHLNEKHGLGLQIDSAGTAGYHINEAPDPRTIANAATHGIDLSVLRGRQFKRPDFQEFDQIFVMDQSNYKNVCALANTQEEKNKVKLLLEIVSPGSKAEVPDPYYHLAEKFEEVFQLVYNACSALMKDHNISRSRSNN